MVLFKFVVGLQNEICDCWVISKKNISRQNSLDIESHQAQESESI